MMNNPRILAQTMASSYLMHSWNMDVLQRAFVEKWPHQLGYALELLCRWCRARWWIW